MGQFFTQVQPEFIDDNMFRLPYEQMADNLQKKDEAVDSEINKAQSFLDKLKAQGLQVDEPRLGEIKRGYEAQVEDIVQKIKANPMEYYKYGSDIRQLGRNIESDWTIGEVAAIQGNKAAHDAFVKNVQELASKDNSGMNQDYVNALIADNLSKYKGVNFKGAGDYTKYKEGDALGIKDMNVWVDERLKNAIPDLEKIERDSTSGMIS